MGFPAGPRPVGGIDPGASGAYAQGTVVFPFKNRTERDIWDLFLKMMPCKVYIEKVHAMPKQGVSSTFKFGQNYGALRMALIAAQIPFEEVRPADWMREFGLRRKKGESDTSWKNRKKAKAQQIFPLAKVTHATADALLIAEYGRRLTGRKETGE